mgnify:FL=1
MKMFLRIFLKYFWLLNLIIFSIYELIVYINIKNKLNESNINYFSKSVFLRICLLINLPWLVMGFYMYMGDIPNVMYFFQPLSFNIWVLLFYIIIFILEIIGFYWIYSNNGADVLSDYANIIGFEISADYIKKQYIIQLIIIISFIIAVFIIDIPVEKININDIIQ